jgi:hypothetical protein
LENIYIANAYYDIMSSSFKPTTNKSLNCLNLIKLTLIDAKDSTLECVPLINNEIDKTEISILRIKFWQKNNSLSNTTSKEIKKNSLSSNDSRSLQNIPIINPIYFCIANPCLQFINEFEQFFKNN